MPDRTDVTKAKFAMGRVSAVAYAHLLLVIGVGFFALHKLHDWSGRWSIDDPLGPISALEVIEGAILFALCRRMARATRFSIEELCIVGLGLGIVAETGGAKLAFGCAAVAFALRLRSVRGATASVCGFLILVAQQAASAGPLFALHRRFGSIDAAIMRGLMRAGGAAATGSGAVVRSPDGTFAIDVNAGCASSYVAVGVIAGFALVILWRRGRFCWADLGWGAVLIGLVTLLNWGRMIPMVFSREAHQFWHDDRGAQIIALLDGALTLGLALLATAHVGRFHGASCQRADTAFPSV